VHRPEDFAAGGEESFFVPGYGEDAEMEARVSFKDYLIALKRLMHASCEGGANRGGVCLRATSARNLAHLTEKGESLLAVLLGILPVADEKNRGKAIAQLQSALDGYKHHSGECWTRSSGDDGKACGCVQNGFRFIKNLALQTDERRLVAFFEKVSQQMLAEELREKTAAENARALALQLSELARKTTPKQRQPPKKAKTSSSTSSGGAGGASSSSDPRAGATGPSHVPPTPRTPERATSRVHDDFDKARACPSKPRTPCIPHHAVRFFPGRLTLEPSAVAPVPEQALDLTNLAERSAPSTHATRPRSFSRRPIAWRPCRRSRTWAPSFAQGS